MIRLLREWIQTRQKLEAFVGAWLILTAGFHGLSSAMQFANDFDQNTDATTEVSEVEINAPKAQTFCVPSMTHPVQWVCSG